MGFIGDGIVVFSAAAATANPPPQPHRPWVAHRPLAVASHACQRPRSGGRRQLWACGVGAMDCGQAGGSDGGSMRPLAGSRKASNGDHYQMCDVVSRQAAAMGQKREVQMACLEELRLR